MRGRKQVLARLVDVGSMIVVEILEWLETLDSKGTLQRASETSLFAFARESVVYSYHAG